MTPEQRRAEFNRLFDSIEGSNIQKIRIVCEILGYKENSVRVMRLTTKPKTIPAFKLKVLQEAIERRQRRRNAITDYQKLTQ